MFFEFVPRSPITTENAVIFTLPNFFMAPSAETEEYADCISAEG